MTHYSTMLKEETDISHTDTDLPPLTAIINRVQSLRHSRIALAVFFGLTAVAVIAPIIGYRIVSRTPLAFFFIRPDMFRLTAPRPHTPKIMVAAGD